MEVINVVEKMVWATIDDILEQKDGICKCEKCRADIVALTLNSLKPCYVVSNEGSAFVRANYLDLNLKHELTLALVHAIEIVSENPKHDKE
ncbi:hypothetical protein SYNTR_2275 [Candidatus Syntrophocurvum alkaliphilum]|uniref:Competence protein ComFB n=1 Tax=Candidatus Syntrophocurvum alkaliphilum TaxID=2293317 RepID=A0A6I6DJX7_9FIRM|nr:late competence development ComFB family protein [Candidatus Syntrophocurvum alkaliphilum]QGU00869.1 hypothetical protein SYNTR_2275 [Candidatus Syntrophocurvum alkaliphilum]